MRPPKNRLHFWNQRKWIKKIDTRNYRNNTLIFTCHKSQTSVFRNFSTDYGNIPRLSQRIKLDVTAKKQIAFLKSALKSTMIKKEK